MKEIKNIGFMNRDFLATILLNETCAKIYVFNYGNFSKIRHALHDMVSNYDKIAIEDWLCDLMRDYKISCYPEIESRKLIDLKEVQGTTLHLEQESASIGQEVVEITVKFLRFHANLGCEIFQ